MSWDMPPVGADALDPSQAQPSDESPVYADEADRDPLVAELGPGFPDNTRTIRVWPDDEGRIIRVRISLRWRERATNGGQLERMLMQGIRFAQARLCTEPWLPTVTIEEYPVNEELTAEAINARIERLRELGERMERMEPIRLVGGGGTGHGARGRVTVTLGQLGETTGIEFDEEWLARSRVGELTAAILEAHEKAYESFQPPVLDASEYTEIMSELERVRYELNSLTPTPI